MLPTDGGQACTAVDGVAQHVAARQILVDRLQLRGVLNHAVSFAVGIEAGAVAGQGDAAILAQRKVAAMVQPEAAVAAAQRQLTIELDVPLGVEFHPGIGATGKQAVIQADVLGRREGQLVATEPEEPVFHRHVALATGQFDMSGCQVARQGVGMGSVALGGEEGAHLDFVAGDLPGARLAIPGLGVDLGRQLHPSVGAPGFDHPAIALAVQRTGAQRAIDADHAHVAAIQGNAPGLLRQGVGFDGALVVDHRLQHGARALGGHQHLPAIGLEQAGAGVVHQRVKRCAVDMQVQQLVVIEADGEAIACGQRHTAVLRLDGALVGHPGPEQRHATAVSGSDGALVDHLGCRGAGELVVAGLEIGIADIPGRSHQATDIHLSALAEHHAVGVDQEHPTIGVDLPVNLAAIDTHDPVQGDRSAGGLVEGHRLTVLHVEILPLSDQLVRLLIDGHVLALGMEIGTAGHHLPSRGQGKRRRQPGQCQQTGNCHHQALAGAGTPTPGAFVSDVPAALGLVPYQCIDLVHENSISIYLRTANLCSTALPLKRSLGLQTGRRCWVELAHGRPGSMSGRDHGKVKVNSAAPLAAPPA